jgi:hypothetical protein
MQKKPPYVFRFELPDEELKMLAWLAKARNLSLSELLLALVRSEYARESKQVEGNLERHAQSLEEKGNRESARRLRAVVERLKTDTQTKKRPRRTTTRSRT